MNSIATYVEQLARMIETIYEDTLSDTSLNRGQYAYLLYLHEHGGANQYDISRDLLIDKTTVAKALKKLESAGQIYRRTDPRDKRKVNVYLTSRGKALYEEVDRANQEIQSIFQTNVNPALVEQFTSLIEIFLAELDLKWCMIKNYKRDTSYSLAGSADIRKILERDFYPIAKEDQLFIERFGQYYLNWFKFRKEEDGTDIHVSDVHFHQFSDIILQGMELFREFEDWYRSNYVGTIYIPVVEGNIPLQKLLHKNGYFFRDFKKNENKENVYIYTKQFHDN